MLVSKLISRSVCSVSNFTRRISLLKRKDGSGCQLSDKETRSIVGFQSKNYATYEGNGKTVAFILNKKKSPVLMLDAVTLEGFVLCDGRELVGSIILFPHSLLSWQILTPEEVNEESLTLFKVLEPKIDILVFGYGAPNQYTPEIRQRFSEICKKLGLRFEALPTVKAVGVFNLLADERRLVAAALIPPKVIDRLHFDRKKHLLLEAELNVDELEEKEELKAMETKKSETKFIK